MYKEFSKSIPKVITCGCLLILFLNSKCWGFDTVDLSAGLALPSPNGAIRENPAGLAKGDSNIFDVSALAQSLSSPNVLGSYASQNSNFGFGLGMGRLNNSFVFSGAFAAATGGFSIGVGASSTISPISPSFSLGIRQKSRKMAYTLVLNDLAAFGRSWSLGLGVAPAENLILGFDLNLTSNSFFFDVNGANLVGIFEYLLDHKFTLRLTYGMMVVPTIALSSPGLGAGINYWFSRKVSLYAILSDYVTYYSYVLGMKFDMN